MSQTTPPKSTCLASALITGIALKDENTGKKIGSTPLKYGSTPKWAVDIYGNNGIFSL